MFEDRTFEAILQEMREDTDPEFDVSETSPLYAAHAINAAQLAKAYRQLDRVLKLGFASTSEGEYLEKRTSELDIYYMPASAAVRHGDFNQTVPLGSRFFVQNMYFKVIKNDNGQHRLECETPGVIGNSIPAGTEIIPVETIEGLTDSVLGEVIIVGEDTENETSLFDRYQEKVADPATSGNIAHYKEWAREVDGVGAVKVVPIWEGPGSVKVIIVDPNFLPVSAELVQNVQDYIDPLLWQQQGRGEAPVGSKVTVESAVAVTLDVSAVLELEEGATIETVTSLFSTALADYVKGMAFKEDNLTFIRQRLIGALLLTIPGIIDYSSLLLNGQAANITLQGNETPVIGQVVISV